VSVDPCAGGISRGGLAGVARRGERDVACAVLGGRRDRECVATIFERAGWIAPFILDVDFPDAQFRGEGGTLDQRGSPFIHCHRGRQREGQ
jgi:hypothetical protein